MQIEESHKQLEERLIAEGLRSKGVHTVEEEEERIKLTTFIHNELKILREDCGAQRTFFMSYHNGVVDGAGNGFLKMTMREEEVKPGETPVAMSFQNVMRSILYTLCNNIHNDGKYYIYNIEDIKDTDYVTYDTLKLRGTLSSFYKEVKAQNGMVIGFIAV